MRVPKRWWAVGLAVLVTTYAVLSLRHVPARGQLAVLDSPVLKWSPRVLPAGWHLVPAGLLATYRYPEGTARLTLALDASRGHRLETRDGSSVGVEMELSYRLLPDRILELHKLVGHEFERTWLTPRVAEVVRDEVSRSEYHEIAAANRYRLERALSAVLTSSLERAGIGLERVEVWRVEAGPLPPALEARDLRPVGEPRILFIGIDSADWALIDPLMEAGELPNLARLVQRGVRSKLRTITPTLSPVIWTTVATGKLPEKHGIVDFLAVDSRTGQQVPVTSNLRRAKTVWNIFNDVGVDVGVIAWWATWPPEAVDGYMISDRVAYQLFGLGAQGSGPGDTVHPPDLLPEIESIRVRPDAITAEDLARFLDLPEGGVAALDPDGAERVDEFRAILAATRTYRAAAHKLFRERPTPFQAVYFEGLDTTKHLFMQFRPPRLSVVGPEGVERFGRAVDEFYRYQDELLGELLQEFGGDEVNVVIASDHGFRHGSNRPLEDARIGGGKAAEWHRKYGVLILSGPAFTEGIEIEDTSVADLAPTMLAVYGLPRADDMDGRILESAFRPGYLDRIPDGALRTYETPDAERADVDPIRSDADAEIVSKLTALGYLSQAGSNSHNNRGVLLMNQGRYDEAVEEFRAALEADPSFLVARINMGRCYMYKGNAQEALVVFEDVLRRDPQAQDVENSVGNIYMERGELALAEEHFLRAVEIEPNNTDVLNSLGILYERQGRWQEAMGRYRRVVEIDPDYGEGYNNLGNVYKLLGSRGEAETMYRRAMEADPTFVGSYNNLALLYQERGDLDGAIALYRKALEKAPDHPKVRLNLGSLYYAQENYQEAVAEFQRALELDPNYPDAHNNLGAVYGRLEEFDKEMEHLQKAVELNPGYADARHNLGLAYLRAGQDERGIDQLRRAVEHNPDYFSALVNLGAALARRGRHQEGIPYLERSLELNPALPQVYNTLAAAYLAVGERDQGIERYKASLGLYPDQPTVRQRLLELGVTVE